ncbi:hypothetical protein Glove_217g265 [Diversispora epigaea]|uniref:Uncharacterized protein n=1 Tax=Diversispora epigaea TaxID=1348612 RepID=A0A397IMV8_9GLOM|nr:hypothetical protein Glove_217g270 [Diversispora epigaea]RHZ75190.1 hypothetical protein Glove_217g265 [Diversispora epigaea]
MRLSCSKPTSRTTSIQKNFSKNPFLNNVTPTINIDLINNMSTNRNDDNINNNINMNKICMNNSGFETTLLNINIDNNNNNNITMSSGSPTKPKLLQLVQPVQLFN